MTKPYTKEHKINKYATNKYSRNKHGLSGEEFFCQKCGKIKTKPKEVINEDGNKIKVCKECWKK